MRLISEYDVPTAVCSIKCVVYVYNDGAAAVLLPVEFKQFWIISCLLDMNSIAVCWGGDVREKWCELQFAVVPAPPLYYWPPVSFPVIWPCYLSRVTSDLTVAGPDHWNWRLCSLPWVLRWKLRFSRGALRVSLQYTEQSVLTGHSACQMWMFPWQLYHALALTFSDSGHLRHARFRSTHPFEDVVASQVRVWMVTFWQDAGEEMSWTGVPATWIFLTWRSIQLRPPLVLPSRLKWKKCGLARLWPARWPQETASQPHGHPQVKDLGHGGHSSGLTVGRFAGQPWS